MHGKKYKLMEKIYGSLLLIENGKTSLSRIL